MHRHKFLRALKILLIAIVAAILFGFVVKALWNWLMPGLFGWHVITFWQGLGLFALSKILFGGFHRHACRRGGWKGAMRARWENMSPEERTKLRQAMWERHGHSVPQTEPEI